MLCDFHLGDAVTRDWMSIRLIASLETREKEGRDGATKQSSPWRTIMLLPLAARVVGIALLAF